MADRIAPSAGVFRVNIVTPERTLFSGEVSMIAVTSVEGELGIFPRHTPLLANLVPGEVKVVNPDGEPDYIYIDGGYLEVQPHLVTILADTGLRGTEVDEAAALEAKRRAEQTIRTSPLYSDRDAAYTELLKALAQLRALEHSRKGKKRGM